MYTEVFMGGWVTWYLDFDGNYCSQKRKEKEKEKSMEKRWE